jgi:hypothetical protein
LVVVPTIIPYEGVESSELSGGSGVPERCHHRRRRVIAQDDAVTYIECLECGLIFDTAELDEPAGEPTDFEEDLSDA